MRTCYLRTPERDKEIPFEKLVIGDIFIMREPDGTVRGPYLAEGMPLGDGIVVSFIE